VAQTQFFVFQHKMNVTISTFDAKNSDIWSIQSKKFRYELFDFHLKQKNKKKKLREEGKFGLSF